MDSVYIVKKIKDKIKEHETEMSACQLNLDARQSELTSKEKPDMVSVAKLATLKDKIMFHKACKMALEDLLGEVNEDN